MAKDNEKNVDSMKINLILFCLPETSYQPNSFPKIKRNNDQVKNTCAPVFCIPCNVSASHEIEAIENETVATL